MASTIQLSNVSSLAIAPPDSEEALSLVTQKTHNTSASVIRRSNVFDSAAALREGLSMDRPGITATQTRGSLAAMPPTEKKSDLQAPALAKTEKKQQAPAPLEALKKREIDQVARDTCRTVHKAVTKEILTMPHECWRFYGPVEREFEGNCHEMVEDYLQESKSLLHSKKKLSSIEKDCSDTAVRYLRLQCEKECVSERGRARDLLKIQAEKALNRQLADWKAQAAAQKCSDAFENMLQYNKAACLKKIYSQLNMASSIEVMEAECRRYFDFFDELAKQEFQRICIQGQITNVPLSKQLQ